MEHIKFIEEICYCKTYSALLNQVIRGYFKIQTNFILLSVIWISVDWQTRFSVSKEFAPFVIFVHGSPKMEATYSSETSVITHQIIRPVDSFTGFCCIPYELRYQGQKIWSSLTESSCPCTWRKNRYKNTLFVIYKLDTPMWNVACKLKRTCYIFSNTQIILLLNWSPVSITSLLFVH
jgi:hypothetical protein